MSRAVGIIFIPKPPGKLIKNPGALIVDAVQWCRSENWYLHMDHFLGGCEEVVRNVSISTLFRYHNV